MTPTLYTALLFIHIASALALFASEGAGQVGLRELRQAGDESAARQALARLEVANGMGHFAPPLLLLSGLGLCFLTWGFRTPWVDLSLAGFTSIAVMLRTVDFPRLVRTQTLLREGAPFETAVRPRLHDPVLRRSGRIRLGLLLWLVLLMSVKPGLILALAVLAAVLTWALVFPLSKRTAVKSQLA